MSATIPQEIIKIGNVLSQAGYDAFLVGGCVRDLVLGRDPKDWDIAIDALPEEVEALFDHSHYDNDFGTVRVVNDEAEREELKVVEITTFRKEGTYSDNRRPDTVEFSTDIKEDLERRDFTINALAYPIIHHESMTFSPEHILDLHNGIEDLENKIIRTVGDPDTRFSEDALRLLRAVRFATQLHFSISHETLQSIVKNADQLSTIAEERIQEEFNKIIMSSQPAGGIELLHRTGLLTTFLPELERGIGIDQNQAHSYTVWEHSLRSLQAAADKNFNLELRLSALFHDIAKPVTREKSNKTGDWTFYNHEVIGSRETNKILKRLKYSKKIVSHVTKLVRWHMFFSDPDQITLSGVRRLIRRVGREEIKDLIKLRICDRIGTGRPKEEPYRLRKFQSMIKEALRDPITVKMLKINGNDLIKKLDLTPSHTIGQILHALMNDVLEDPTKNNHTYLMDRAKELVKLPTEELKKLSDLGKLEQNSVEKDEIKQIRSKFHVK